MIGSTYLELKFPKNPFERLKVKSIWKISNKEIIYSPFNLIILDTTNYSNSLHGQTFLKDTIFSVLRTGLKHLIGLRNVLMDIYFLSMNFLIIFSLYLNPAMHRIGNSPSISSLRCKEKESTSYFVFYSKLSNTKLGFMTELMNLNYSFNTPFKISLKRHWELSSQLDDGAQLKILLKLLEIFLRHLSFHCRQAAGKLGLLFKQQWKT